MKQTRRRFSREFELEAVRQLTHERRLVDAARARRRRPGVRSWVGQVAFDPATAFPGNGRFIAMRLQQFCGSFSGPKRAISGFEAGTDARQVTDSVQVD